MFKIQISKSKFQNQAGFTLMEILVATTIFAVVVAALMSMFNYTLRLNRRTEALRQATQGMRDLVEFITKEVRNGQIDYRVSNGQTAMPAVGPCAPQFSGTTTSVPSTYSLQDNKFSVLTPEGDAECFFLAYGGDNKDSQATSTYAGAGVNVSSSNHNPNPILALQKNSLPVEVLTPPNMSIQKLYFYVRPTCDPYSPFCLPPYSGYAKFQPLVNMLIEFKVVLTTGETTDIYYQTTVAGTKYDIPNQ